MQLKTALQKARKGGYAIGAFNAANLETLKAIFQAAQAKKSPVIIESSSGEVDFIGPENLVTLVKNMSKEYSVPAFVNLDHAHDVVKVQHAIAIHFDLVHYDGSKKSKGVNTRHLKKIVPIAHREKILVEGEMDHITGSSAPQMSTAIDYDTIETMYTHPEAAKKFIDATGIDILAVFVGNVHGIYKNKPHIDFERLKAIKKITKCFLSLHGGSGIPAASVKKAIEVGGIVKVNVNTELRVAYRTTLEKVLKKTDEVAIYKIMPEVITAVQKVVEKKMEIFGSIGKA